MQHGQSSQKNWKDLQEVKCRQQDAKLQPGRSLYTAIDSDSLCEEMLGNAHSKVPLQGATLPMQPKKRNRQGHI